jgi:hypothetical protein
VTWIVNKAKALGKMVVSGGKAVVAKVMKALGVSISFSGGGGGHRLWVDLKGGGARVMMATTPRSMADHIADFSTKAASLPDAAVKSKVVGAIRMVTALNTYIETQGKTVAGKPIGDADRDKVDKQVEGAERKMQSPLIFILDSLSISAPKETTKVTCQFLKSSWTSDPGLAGEWTRQLQRQQAQINGMSVHIWMERRAQYAQFKKQGDAKPLDAKARAAIRKRFEDIIATRLEQPMNAPAGHPAVAAANRIEGVQMIVAAIFSKVPPVRQAAGLTPAEARIQAEAGIKGKAVLHEPDKVAAGRYDEIQDIGSNAINGDIGANWAGMSFDPKVTGRKHLVKMIEGDVTKEMTQKNVERALWRAVKMNVELKA